MAVLPLISRGTPTGREEEEEARVDSSLGQRGEGSSLPAEPGERFGSSAVCDGRRGVPLEANQNPGLHRSAQLL